MTEYAVSFTINGYEATLDETFATEDDARGVAASLERNGADIAHPEPV